MNRLAVIGAGSWGTALSLALAPRFSSIHLWSRTAFVDPRQNQRYLPGFPLPPNVVPTDDLAGAVDCASIVLLAIPSAYFRHTLENLRPHLPAGAPLVSATKGIEIESLYRMSQLIHNVLGPVPSAVLSGPTFAREIAAGEPAAVVLAAQDSALAAHLQHSFSTPTLRLYASSDVTGVEIGGALKNVIAIGAGVCHGLGLGSNSVAALVTRGLAEITRLALALGAQPRTLAGLAGLGDLVLTATGDLSRNRSVGIQLGHGLSLPQILSQMNMVAEGINTCRAAAQLARRHSLDLPITEKMYDILYLAKSPRQAIRELLDRPLTSE